MDAAPALTQFQDYLPGFRRRVGLIVCGLLTLLDRSTARHPSNIRLWRHLYRLARRFFDLMDRLAAGHLPRPRLGAHTGGRPHPENLSRGTPFRLDHGWLVAELGFEAARFCAQLEAALGEPAARELLTAVPAAERILRPICRLLGTGRFNRYPRPDQPRRGRARLRTDPASRAAALSPGVLPPLDPSYKCRPLNGLARPPFPELWYGFDPPIEKPP